MFKKYITPLVLAVLVSFPAVASVTDSLIVGGIAGLTAGAVSGAISRHRHCHRRCRRRGCRCRRPVFVKERVYYRRPVIVEAPIDDIRERKLALKEQQMQLDLLRAENERRKLALKEKELALKIIELK